MRYRGWKFLASAFGALLLLLSLSGIAILRKLAADRKELAATQDLNLRLESLIADLRSDLQNLSIQVRDHLTNDDPLDYASEQRSMQETRARLLDTVENLRTSAPPPLREDTHHLAESITSYLGSIEVVFLWSLEDRARFRRSYIRNNLDPQREAISKIVRSMNQASQRFAASRRQRIIDSQDQLRVYVRYVLFSSLVLGTVVSLIALYRILKLERKNVRDRAALEESHAKLEELSQQLVRAQEEERRSLSRELHDEVGQILTALRMEVGNLNRLRDGARGDFDTHWKQAKALSDRALQSVRDLSMVLRPSMLDDFGLEPALNWQARNFSRRQGIPCDLRVEGDLSLLSEKQRIFTYRIVQEALTNCARHAHATEVEITIHRNDQNMTLTIRDNGRGFDTHAELKQGVGLLGIGERARELGGVFTVFSQPNKGTLVRVQVPMEEVPA